MEKREILSRRPLKAIEVHVCVCVCLKLIGRIVGVCLSPYIEMRGLLYRQVL